MSLLPVQLPIHPGTTYLNKYNFIRRIGSGSFGEVWLALDQAVNHEYAVKVLNAGIAVDQRLREAQVGHLFTHNNLVRVHQADVATDGKVVIAMDYFPEGSITTLANPAHFLPLPLALKAVVDMLRGLEHLHLNNFFHNDVKPQNILRGPQGQAKLADYGIVGFSATGAPVQPIGWYKLHAAPEMVAGRGIEAKTDVFQTGLTLFRLLVGIGALEAKFQSLGEVAYNAAIASGTLINQSDFPPYIPSAVRRVVLKATEAQPSNRYQTALEMRRALEGLAYPGYWTIDASGDLLGVDDRHHFRVELTPLNRTTADLEARRLNRSSGRETRVTRFTRSGIRLSDATRLRDNFIKAVVSGDVN